LKFVRFGDPSQERPGVLVSEETIVDISSLVADIGPESVSGLPTLVERVRRAAGLPEVALESVRLGPPISRPHKIIGIGLNYVDHANEAAMEIPSEPIVFMKASSSLSGPYDNILMPPGARKLDWEVELGVVIGATARYLADEAEAQSVIAGYAVAHDVSERFNQLERGGQWTKGKSADTFSPVGPWLVTPDEVGDIADLSLACRVNGETKQSGSTSMMIFAPDHLVWYLSQFMTLEPGDLIMTGTPPGVGLATGTYLKDGDVIELEVEGLGTQRQVCRTR
jgi:2-keto-4-pentenoate hydratase/2-oxohepta-3-ene-1,7-dioic acid hydratase in catechol pathway